MNIYHCHRNGKGGTKKKRSFIPGDLVMVLDLSAPQGSWMLATVLETFPDKRGLVRVVHLKTKMSIIDRPVTKICLLSEAVFSQKKCLYIYMYMCVCICIWLLCHGFVYFNCSDRSN